MNFNFLTITSLLFADDVVLLTPSDCDISINPGQFAAECEAAEIRVSTSKSETRALCRKTVDYSLPVGNVLLPQVKDFKYLWVLFMIDGKIECEIDRWVGAASAGMLTLY